MSIGKSKNKKEIKKINDDMALMWFNWSVAIIIATLQLLDTYRYIYIYIANSYLAALQWAFRTSGLCKIR